MPKQPSHLDARGLRGILSRGTAHYGVSNSPKPGNITNIQKAAQERLKKMRQNRMRNGN